MNLADHPLLNPKKLADKLRKLPEGTIVLHIHTSTGLIETAVPIGPDNEIGSMVYNDDTVFLWTGRYHMPYFKLHETGGGENGNEPSLEDVSPTWEEEQEMERQAGKPRQ